MQGYKYRVQRNVKRQRGWLYRHDQSFLEKLQQQQMERHIKRELEKQKKIKKRQEIEKRLRKEVEKKRKEIMQRELEQKIKQAINQVAQDEDIEVEDVEVSSDGVSFRLHGLEGIGATFLPGIMGGILSSVGATQETFENFDLEPGFRSKSNGDSRIAICITIRFDGKVEVGFCKNEDSEPYAVYGASIDEFPQMLHGVECDGVRQLKGLQALLGAGERDISVEKNVNETVTVRQACKASGQNTAKVTGKCSEKTIITALAIAFSVLFVISIFAIVGCIAYKKCCKKKKKKIEEDDLIPVEEDVSTNENSSSNFPSTTSEEGVNESSREGDPSCEATRSDERVDTNIQIERASDAEGSEYSSDSNEFLDDLETGVFSGEEEFLDSANEGNFSSVSPSDLSSSYDDDIMASSMTSNVSNLSDLVQE